MGALQKFSGTTQGDSEKFGSADSAVDEPFFIPKLLRKWYQLPQMELGVLPHL